MSDERQAKKRKTDIEDGDLRKILGVEQSTVMEIKWCYEFKDETKWKLATIHVYDTGRTHRIYDGETDDVEFEDVPIISIHYSDEKDVYHDMCFLGEHVVFDVETKTLLPWRVFGDIYEEGDDDDGGDDSFTESMTMVCEDEEDLKKQIDTFVTSMFINILGKYTDTVNSLPVEAADVFTTQAITFKKVLSEKIVEHFIGSDGFTEGKVMFLERDDIEEIIEKCLRFYD